MAGSLDFIKCEGILEEDHAAEEPTEEPSDAAESEKTNDAAVEKVEGEVVLDPNVIRGYKEAMSAQIRQLGNYLENENWEAMEAVAKDIAWRCGKMMNR